MSGINDPAVALYIAAAVALVVWLGIWFYIWRIDVQARALRRAMEERSQRQSISTSQPMRPERRTPAASQKE